MRYLEITVPEGNRRAVLDILEDEGINYVVSDETSGRGYAGVVRFPVPTRAVEPVLDRLKRAGLGDESSVVVINAETVLSEQFSTLRDRYSEGGTGARTSRQVLWTKADELTPPFSIYAVMLLISAVVATAGLFADSPAVVIGAMVIAPLLGPALAANVGIVTGDNRLKATGFSYQLAGVTIVVVASIALAVLARFAGLEPAGVDIVVATELESSAENEVETVLADAEYDHLRNEDVAVALDGNYPIQSVDRVVVTVSGEEPGPEPGLADRLYAAIEPHSDDSLVIEVQYVVAEQRGGDEIETETGTGTESQQLMVQSSSGS